MAGRVGPPSAAGSAMAACRRRNATGAASSASIRPRRSSAPRWTSSAATWRTVAGSEGSSNSRLAEFDADDLLIVSHEQAPARERRVAPDDIAAAGSLARLEDVGPVEFLVALRRQVCQDQVALVGEE